MSYRLARRRIILFGSPRNVAVTAEQDVEITKCFTRTTVYIHNKYGWRRFVGLHLNSPYFLCERITLSARIKRCSKFTRKPSANYAR